MDADLSEADALEYLILARNWRVHWNRAAFSKSGYDPWHEDTPHEKQQAFHDADARFKAFVGSIGSGKSVAGAAETIKHLFSEPGATWIVAAPTYRMLMSSTMPAFFAILQDQAVARSNKTEMVWELTNGSTVYFRSTDRPDTIRGIDAAGFWLDEGAYSTKKAWEVLIGRLRQVGFEHRGLVTTTPQGMNWLHAVFVDPETRHEDAVWVRATIYDNPWLSEDYVKSLESGYGGRFAKQELRGEFVGAEGLVYPQFSFDTHVREWPEGKDPHDVLYGTDWGWTNPHCTLVAYIDGDGRMWVVDEIYGSRMDTEDVGRTVRDEWFRKYGKGRNVADPSEPEFIDQWNRLGIPTEGATNDILPGINEVSARLDVQGDGLPRFFISEKCEHTIKEMAGGYRYPETADDKPVKEKPIDKNNHGADVCRYLSLELRDAPQLQMVTVPQLDMVI